MLKVVGKFVGQMIPPICATLIGAYLVHSFFPMRQQVAAPPPAPPPSLVLSTAETAKLGIPGTLTGAAAGPSEVSELKPTVTQPAAPAPRRAAVVRERTEMQTTRHDVAPLDLAARVLSAMPPAKQEAAPNTSQISAVSEPDVRTVQPPLVLAPQPQPAAPVRTSQSRDPLVVTDVERAELAEIPQVSAEPAPASPSLLARSGQLVRRAVGSIGSVFHKNDQ